MLGDILELDGNEAGEVLGIEPAAYRLSRARSRIAAALQRCRSPQFARERWPGAARRRCGSGSSGSAQATPPPAAHAAHAGDTAGPAAR